MFTDAPFPLGRLGGRCDDAEEAKLCCKLALYASRDGEEWFDVYCRLLGEAATKGGDAKADV